MTTFTRIRINPRHRAARHALASNERIHTIVQRAAAAGSPDENRQRTLWRLDPGRTAHALYIVSDSYVNASVVQEQFGAELSDIATCSYDPFLARLATGQQWRFRLKANPTKSIGSRQPGVRGKRIPITKQNEQIEWLTQQASRCGFHIPFNRLDVPEAIVRDSGAVSFMRQDRQVTLHSAIFDGFLAIDDPAAFRQALVTGIGRGRGYGFGLLTIVPVPNPASDDAPDGA